MVKKITKSDVIEVFLSDYSKRVYLREIAFLLGKSHQSIKPYVESLTKEKILNKYERRNLIEFGLNFKNKKIFDYLVIAEKEKLIRRLEYEVILKTLYEKLSDYFNSHLFVVFGSGVNKIKKESDIDLLVVGKGISKVIQQFEEVYSKKIHVIQVSRLDKLSLRFVKEIYNKHLIFNDTEKVIRFFGGLYEKNKLV